MNFQLSTLPEYSKTFALLFCLLVLGIIMWMILLGFMHAGILGTHNDPGLSENTVKMEGMLAESEGVTESVWDDTLGILAEDDEFEHAVDDLSDEWAMFQENVEWTLEHVGVQSLLFFAIGFLFMGTGIAGKTKKRIYWSGFVLIVLHMLGLSGCGFCTPANILLYVTGPLILVVFFAMTIMIMIGLKSKR